MKKILFIAIATMISVVVFAQEPKVTEIKSSQLPKEVPAWVKQNVPGGTIVRAGKIEEKGVISYAAVVEVKGQKRSYLFDKNGKFTGKGDNLFKGKGQKPATKAPAPKTTPAANTDPKQQPAADQPKK